ncbi:hypothetical protein Caci_2858 [Catenulispora acidiphila DSM 44928]|uniref:Uncharacterized protein n=1 Tax=Catenulispora acidiphila (strain DSM 44928 / JCM 14897 / NBRC 102108 / NRRL B-24433 / ID139908) TaxID=479433 RepID=C7Q192_CATAD|nr:hypothetical protein [Catenulispora acidiphila]ACU71767.1 hypothetical protein Caci_2858 [Catenulispora acidiphila DSM 44928]
MADTHTVYASIGNSDDKLTQARWSEFHGKFTAAVRSHSLRIYGDWTSPGADPWQNACVAFEIGSETTARLRRDLAELAAEYDQGSIAWAEAETQFIGPTTPASVVGAAPSTLADDVLDWAREHPWTGDLIPAGDLTIEQDRDGTVRIVEAPEVIAVDIALLRHHGLAGVAYADGVLAIDTESGALRYRLLYAIDPGFVIVFRRES